MLRDIFGAVYWSLLPSTVVSLLAGAFGVAFWIYVEEVDSDLCTIRSDGQGMIPLHQQFGPEVYCDPKWGMVAFGTIYYAVIVLPVIIMLWAALRFIYLRAKLRT